MRMLSIFDKCLYCALLKWESLQVNGFKSRSTHVFLLSSRKLICTLSIHTGYYIYMTGFQLRRNDKVVLRSPTYRRSRSTSCFFHIWYHMHGRLVGQLHVNMHEYSWFYTLLSLRGDQGNVWKRSSVPMPVTRYSYAISFYVSPPATVHYLTGVAPPYCSFTGMQRSWPLKRLC